MEIIDLEKIGVEKATKIGVEFLKRGCVVMHATETCYGLAADISKQEAVQKVYAIKQMSPDKPVSVMVRSREEAEKYAVFGDEAIMLAKKYWPGPLTLVLPCRAQLPIYLNNGVSTVGLRCPAHELSLSLVRGTGGPLTTTSANITKLPEVYSVTDYLSQKSIGVLKPDLIIDSGQIPFHRPSTIIVIKGGDNGKSLPIFLREGELASEIRQLFKQKL